MEPINERSYTEKCPLRRALDKIGSKWKIPILWELNINGVMRFNQLKHEVYGITNAMLTSSLQELADDGLVVRTQYNEMPLRVEYKLTDAGRELFPILKDLAEWGEHQSRPMVH